MILSSYQLSTYSVRDIVSYLTNVSVVPGTLWVLTEYIIVLSIY